MNSKEINQEEKKFLRKMKEDAETKVRQLNKFSMEEIMKNKALGYELDFNLSFLESCDDWD